MSKDMDLFGPGLLIASRLFFMSSSWNVVAFPGHVGAISESLLSGNPIMYLTLFLIVIELSLSYDSALEVGFDLLSLLGDPCLDTALDAALEAALEVG